MKATYQRYACIMPVMIRRGKPDRLEPVHVTTLASSVEDAKRMAKEAGLVFLGIIDNDGKITVI